MITDLEKDLHNLRVGPGKPIVRHERCTGCAYGKAPVITKRGLKYLFKTQANFLCHEHGEVDVICAGYYEKHKDKIKDPSFTYTFGSRWREFLGLEPRTCNVFIKGRKV